MSVRFTTLLLVLALSLWTLPARAVDLPDDSTKALPCRPTIACTADIVAPGLFELESGALFRHVESPGPEWSFPFLAKLTLVKWLQIQVGSNGFTTTQQPAQGVVFLDDLTYVAKFHLLDVDPNGPRPSVALSAALSVPSFTPQPGYVSSYDTLFIAYASKDFGPIHADGNVGLELWNVDASPNPQEFATLALSATPVDPFGVMAEAYYFSDASPAATHDGGFLFGVTHSPRPWLVFDAGADIGFLPSTRTFSTFFGMTIVPVVLWK